MLEDCKTGKGYVLGNRFVGGLAGGFTGSGVKQNDTNSSDVFGSRYVGGIVSVNGSNSQINGMTNTGLVAAFGKNAAYVGGIVASMMPAGAAVKTRLPQPPCRTAPTVCPATTPPTPAASTC